MRFNWIDPQEGHKATVKLLLDAGANPDEEDPEGKAPLHIAAEIGRHEVIQVLIEGVADPN